MRYYEIPRHEIDYFRKEYEFLSNFYPTKISFDGILYRSSEAAYQAQKTSGQSYPCIRRERATEAGFPHLYYPSAPAYAKRFLEACGEFQVRKTRRRR